MSYFLLDLTIFNSFKIITIILILKYLVKGLEIEQGSQFIVTCYQSTKIIEDHSLTLNIIEINKSFKCLSDCTSTNYAQCNRLRQGISDISCEPTNCHQEPQCNFSFNSPSIRLDGVRVGCYDNDENVTEWDIKGSDFYEFVRCTLNF